jgi:hypothetical protein
MELTQAEVVRHWKHCSVVVIKNQDEEALIQWLVGHCFGEVRCGGL